MSWLEAATMAGLGFRVARDGETRMLRAAALACSWRRFRLWVSALSGRGACRGRRAATGVLPPRRTRRRAPHHQPARGGGGVRSHRGRIRFIGSAGGGPLRRVWSGGRGDRFMLVWGGRGAGQVGGAVGGCGSDGAGWRR